MVALLIAATAPELNLRGVTCVAGNVEIHHVARNTGKILQHGGTRRRAGQHRRRPTAATPAADRAGDARADRHRLRRAARRGPQAGRAPSTRPSRRRATWRAHVQPPSRRDDASWRSDRSPTWRRGRHQRRRPRRRARAQVVWMGGTLEERGNTTETGEWNACVDPEAAEACLRGRRDRPHVPAGRHAGRRLHAGGPRAPCRTPTWPASCATRSASTSASISEADGIDGCYLHDPVTLIGALLRPDLVTETVDERLACDTGSDPHLAGSLYRSEEADRPRHRDRDRHRAGGHEGRAARTPGPRRQRFVAGTKTAQLEEGSACSFDGSRPSSRFAGRRGRRHRWLAGGDPGQRRGRSGSTFAFQQRGRRRWP